MARVQKPDTDSLRSSALSLRKWPDDNAGLRTLALLFLPAFANVYDPAKAEKHLPAYLGVLATMRSRGVPIATAWQTCVDAREANGGKPLFSAAIRTALSFLPARPAQGYAPQRSLRVVNADDLEALP